MRSSSELRGSKAGSKVPPETILGLTARTLTLGEGTRSLRCLDCRIPLNLLQPDENEPGRLLGICDQCSKWVFLMELEADWGKTLMVELPTGPSPAAPEG